MHRWSDYQNHIGWYVHAFYNGRRFTKTWPIWLDLCLVRAISKKTNNAFRYTQTAETDNFLKTNCNKITSLRLFQKLDFNYKVCYYTLLHINHILMVFNFMAITCSKFLSQLLVSSFQLLLPVVVSCIVWMFVVRLWSSFWGQWQNPWSL